MNSGWTSAQNSCSHSDELAPALGESTAGSSRRPGADAAPPTRAARAATGRARAARAGSSCPCAAVRRRTAARRSARRAIAGVAATLSCSRSHVWSIRSTSPRVSTRPSRCSCDSRVDRVEQPPVRLLPARPLGLAEVVEAGRRARATSSSSSASRLDDAARIADRLAEQVHPPDPIGMHQFLRHAGRMALPPQPIDKGDRAPWPTLFPHPPTSPHLRTTVFEYVRRPANHAEISGDGTVQGSPNGAEVLGPDDKFGMSMKLGFIPYRVTSKVVEFEDDRRIAWCHLGGHRWRWDVEPAGDGARVTLTYDQSTAKSRPRCASSAIRSVTARTSRRAWPTSPRTSRPADAVRARPRTTRAARSPSRRCASATLPARAPRHQLPAT